MKDSAKHSKRKDMRRNILIIGALIFALLPIFVTVRLLYIEDYCATQAENASNSPQDPTASWTQEDIKKYVKDIPGNFSKGFSVQLKCEDTQKLFIFF